MYSGFYNGELVAIKTKKNHGVREMNIRTLKALMLDLKTCSKLQQQESGLTNAERANNNNHIVKLICANTSNLKNGNDHLEVVYLASLPFVFLL